AGARREKQPSFGRQRDPNGRVPKIVATTELAKERIEIRGSEGNGELSRGRLQSRDVIAHPERDSVIGAQRLEEPATVEKASIGCGDARLVLGKERAVEPNDHKSGGPSLDRLIPNALAMAAALVSDSSYSAAGS